MYLEQHISPQQPSVDGTVKSQESQLAPQLSRKDQLLRWMRRASAVGMVGVGLLLAACGRDGDVPAKKVDLDVLPPTPTLDISLLRQLKSPDLPVKQPSTPKSLPAVTIAKETATSVPASTPTQIPTPVPTETAVAQPTSQETENSQNEIRMSGEFNFETLGNFDKLPLTAQLQSYANNEAVFVDTNSSTGKSVTYHLLMAPIYKDVYSESDLVRMLPEQFGSFYFLERRHEEFNSGDEARYGYGVFTTPDFQRLLVEGHEQEYEKHWADEAEYNLPGFIHSEFSINQSNLDLYRTQRNLRLFPKENMPSVPYFINEINQNEEYTQLVVFNIATGAKITLYLSADEFSQSQWSNVKVKQTVSIQASSVAFDPEGQTDLVPFLEWQMPGIKNTVGVLRFEYKLDFRKIPSSLTVTPN